MTARFPADGVFETWLFFRQRIEPFDFAARTPTEQAEAKAAMRRFFDGFLATAAAAPGAALSPMAA